MASLIYEREIGGADRVVGHICIRCIIVSSQLDSCFERVSMGLTVSRKAAKNLAVRRKNEIILTVSRKKNVNRKKI